MELYYLINSIFLRDLWFILDLFELYIYYESIIKEIEFAIESKVFNLNIETLK